MRQKDDTFFKAMHILIMCGDKVAHEMVGNNRFLE
jgi:hypothetical protein